MNSVQRQVEAKIERQRQLKLRKARWEQEKESTEFISEMVGFAFAMAAIIALYVMLGKDLITYIRGLFI